MRRLIYLRLDSSDRAAAFLLATVLGAVRHARVLHGRLQELEAACVEVRGCILQLLLADAHA